MTNEINRPIFLTYFPVEIKSFCMQRAENDKRVTEPIDVLMPGVGEIVGGSMRTWDYDELMAAYKLKTSTRPATFGTWISLSTVLHPTEVRARWRKVRNPFLFALEMLNLTSKGSWRGLCASGLC